MVFKAKPNNGMDCGLFSVFSDEDHSVDAISQYRRLSAPDEKGCTDESENVANVKDPTVGKQNNPGNQSKGESNVVAKKKSVPDEVDFDTNPTAVYRALYRRQWEAAMILLRSNPKEASTWISRKELDGTLRWRLLPLHCAIIYQGPEKIIRALLYAYPGSATAKDDQGMLPHQLAHHVGSPKNIVLVLLKAIPPDSPELAEENKTAAEATPPPGATSKKTDAGATSKKTVSEKETNSKSATTETVDEIKAKADEKDSSTTLPEDEASKASPGLSETKKEAHKETTEPESNEANKDKESSPSEEIQQEATASTAEHTDATAANGGTIKQTVRFSLFAKEEGLETVREEGEEAASDETKTMSEDLPKTIPSMEEASVEVEDANTITTDTKTPTEDTSAATSVATAPAASTTSTTAHTNATAEGSTSAVTIIPAQAAKPPKEAETDASVAAGAPSNAQSEIQAAMVSASTSFGSVRACHSKGEAATPEEREFIDATVDELRRQYEHEVQVVKAETLIHQNKLAKTIVGLRQEVNKTKENTQVLADHASSLENQLNNRCETERYLATRIAKLDSQLKSISIAKEANEQSLKAGIKSIAEQKSRLLEEVDKLRIGNQEALGANEMGFKEVEERKQEMQLEIEKLKKKIKAMEHECEQTRADADILELQLKKRIENESALAVQATTLAGKLASSGKDRGGHTSAFLARIRVMERERDDLRTTEQKLSKKLAKVIGIMKAMATEQEVLTKQAKEQEEQLAIAAADHNKVVDFAKQQEAFIEKAREHSRILSYVNKQKDLMDIVQQERSEVTNMLKCRALKHQKSSQVLSALELHRDHLDAGRKRRKELALAAADLNSKLMQVMKDVNGDVAQNLVHIEGENEDDEVVEADKQEELVDHRDSYNTYTQTSADGSETNVELVVREKVSFTDDIADLRGVDSCIDDIVSLRAEESRLEVHDYLVGDDTPQCSLEKQQQNKEQGQGARAADQRDDCEEKDEVTAAIKDTSRVDSDYWAVDPADDAGDDDVNRFFDILGDKPEDPEHEVARKADEVVRNAVAAATAYKTQQQDTDQRLTKWTRNY